MFKTILMKKYRKKAEKENKIWMEDNPQTSAVRYLQVTYTRPALSMTRQAAKSERRMEVNEAR